MLSQLLSPGRVLGAWDVDPAAIRRAPLRMRLNTPTPDQRFKILKILHQDVTLLDIARLAMSFSGSDLCVSAAMNSVTEQVISPSAGGFTS